MRLILSYVVTAVLAVLASAAPTTVAPEETTDLPARFAMYLGTADTRINGLRIRYLNSYLHLSIDDSPSLPSVDGVFLGGRGRVALDLAVHTVPKSDNPRVPEFWGDWNMLFYPEGTVISFESEAIQEYLSTWPPLYHPVVGTWVQDSNHVLRLINDEGVLEPNSIRLCNRGSYEFWWSNSTRLDCPVAEFKIVAL